MIIHNLISSPMEVTFNLDLYIPQIHFAIRFLPSSPSSLCRLHLLVGQQQGLTVPSQLQNQILHSFCTLEHVDQVRVICCNDRRQVHRLEQECAGEGASGETQAGEIADDDVGEVGVAELCEFWLF
jgi:hypothetical protein